MTGWVVKPMSINDVPIVTLTLYSNAADDYAAAGGWRTNCCTASRAFPTRAAPTWWPGGSARCGLWPIPSRLAGHGLDLAAVAKAIEVSNVNLPAGHFSRQDREYLVEAGPFLKIRR